MHPGIPDSADLLSRHALLLDIDGTLLDIAPTPEQVHVPEGLPMLLASLHRQMGGALALVTGRPLVQAVALMGSLPTSAEHGAVLCLPPAEPVRLNLPRVPDDWRAAAARLAEAHPGARVETKHAGFVLHYRAIPEAGLVLEQGLRDMIAGDARFEILPASMAWELRPRGTDKGIGLNALMESPAFAGRLPLFIGDDVTDQAAIAAAEAMGGMGLQMDASFETPTALRAWLASLPAEAEEKL
ncbi:trehalose-phosphatase [Rhodovarius crocodyli]|uniref:Trehalose 6-phosphate phosphatase n=1 Tax=Rhodovarius crocodyli TaxID=1979269 RepID=A0A437MIV7_9PROT|nr:trehalose-phosphatase [Rhodovarius crocodyli]RVT97604.1 trehalose-phosphatase [Rhodovarius crocodyli]